MYLIISIILLCLITLIIKYNNKEGLKNNYKYTALIIEPRKHKALEFVLQNFNDNLSDECQFIVFHGNQNKEYTENICKRVFIPERVKLVQLNVDKLNLYTYSGILLDKSFYDNIKTEYFLVFQTDSIICSKYKNTINDFLKYEYVGAPFGDNDNIGNDTVGNGGLSLRKKSKMLEILDNCKTKNSDNQYLMEDRVFAYSCNNIPIYKPSLEKAAQFSIESNINNNKAFGIHKAFVYLDDKKINSIKEWCPEITKLTELNNLK
jgi:hypothetical protein